MKTLDNRKIVLVGTGFVGMSFAYSLLSQPGIDELVRVFDTFITLQNR